jgi:hypothetical protein
VLFLGPLATQLDDRDQIAVFGPADQSVSHVAQRTCTTATAIAAGRPFCRATDHLTTHYGRVPIFRQG